MRSLWDDIEIALINLIATVGHWFYKLGQSLWFLWKRFCNRLVFACQNLNFKAGVAIKAYRRAFQLQRLRWHTKLFAKRQQAFLAKQRLAEFSAGVLVTQQLHEYLEIHHQIIAEQIKLYQQRLKQQRIKKKARFQRQARWHACYRWYKKHTSSEF